MAEEPVYQLTLSEAKRVSEQLKTLRRDVEGLLKRAKQGQQGSAEHYRYKHFRVMSVEDDYLVCRIYLQASDETRPDDIAVAKPYGLRKTPFDGETIEYTDGTTLSYSYTSQRERTATDTSDSSTETQVVAPDYFTSEPAGQDGTVILAVAGHTGMTDNGGDPILWTDINNDVRGWVKESS